MVIEGVNRSKLIDTIVLASSINPENDPLISFWDENSVSLFRGDEENVLSRYVQVTRDNAFDIVVRLTGDNPVIDSVLLDEVIEHHIHSGNDYTITTGLPVGMNFEIIAGHVLLRLQREELSADDREHVTLCIRNSNKYKTQSIDFSKHKNLQKLRLTVDYPSDFIVLSLILSLLKLGEFPDIDFIARLNSDHAWLFTCNIENVQRNQVKRN